MSQATLDLFYLLFWGGGQVMMRQIPAPKLVCESDVEETRPVLAREDLFLFRNFVRPCQRRFILDTGVVRKREFQVTIKLTLKLNLSLASRRTVGG